MFGELDPLFGLVLNVVSLKPEDGCSPNCIDILTHV